MDPLTNLYTRLRQQREKSGELAASWPQEPPQPEAWLHYWNDEETEFGNLRNFEHWLSRARPQASAP